MDSLSSAASGIAVVSVVIQLADSVKKLCNFLSSIKEAPQDVRTLVIDLQLLSSVLAEIANETQLLDIDVTFVAILEECSAKVKELLDLFGSFDFVCTSTYRRNWSSVKKVLSDSRIRKFQDNLERLKGTLVLAQQHQLR